MPNPYYPPRNTLFVSSIFETSDKLSDLLIDVGKNKINKIHKNKENTVLIIDNRTGAYDVKDYFEALDCINPLVQKWPFPEVWFYTGYFSDNNGQDAEFSFAPLKTTAEQSKVLEEMIKSKRIDEYGRYVWS